MEQIQELKSLLSVPKSCVILSHRNPDGDALGSSLALSLFLQSFNHQVKVIFPSEFPVNYEWMPQSGLILIYDLDSKSVESAISSADLIFCLDFNSLERIDRIGPLVLARNVPKILIDHHLDPEPFADLVFSFEKLSSTSEIIYDLICLLQTSKRIDPLILDCLYTGLMTDTGSFHHATSPKVFQMMSEMKEQGLDDTLIQELVNNSQPDKYLKLLGHCLHNRMELIPEHHLGIISLTKDDYRNFDIQRGDTEGIINYLMMLKSVKIGALIMNQPTIVKLSLRSKGNISVQQICRQNFNGGGHKNASGGSSKLSLEDTILKLKEVVSQAQINVYI